jgi:Fe-S cluster assembly protein SufD
MSTATARHPYIQSLLKGWETPRGGISWLNDRRAQALERANALAVPTTRDEEWRFTDITPLTKVAFQPVSGAAQVTMADVSGYIVPEATTHLVFVDGVYNPALSANAGLPYGVVVAPLAAALATHGAVIEPHLARLAGFESDVFAALNTAHLRDGAFIWLAKNQKCPTPVHLLHVATRADAVSYPRCLVVAEAGSECTLIEEYVSLADAVHFTNAVTEIAAGEGSRVRHVRVQRESAGAFHIARCAAALDKEADYASHAVTLGARISRFSLDVVQRGEGAVIRMDGLALIAARQLADTHTFMDHARAHGSCTQSHKCIVGGAAHAVFNGKILVRPGAQLTNSSQQNRNLLLSDKARVDTKPQLEIFADDVKCAHGATVGQLDEEHVFYLRSRGLSPERARNLLTYAFAAEMIDRIPVPSLVEQLEETVLARTVSGLLPGTEGRK